MINKEERQSQDYIQHPSQEQTWFSNRPSWGTKGSQT